MNGFRCAVRPSHTTHVNVYNVFSVHLSHISERFDQFEEFGSSFLGLVGFGRVMFVQVTDSCKFVTLHCKFGSVGTQS